MYLMQERELKSKTFGAASTGSRRQHRDDIGYHSLTVGFVLLTLGMITGIVWSKQRDGTYWHFDPKEVMALVTWFVYLFMIHYRLTAGWRGGGPPGWPSRVSSSCSSLGSARDTCPATMSSGEGADGSPTMGIVLIGISHKTAPVEVRERVAFAETRLAGALQEMVDRETVSEGLIVSTCNRIEILALVAGEPASGIDQPRSSSTATTASRTGASSATSTRAPTSRRSACLPRRSSLDSMVVGEPQILGQVKDAYHIARGARTVGQTLNRS